MIIMLICQLTTTRSMATNDIVAVESEADNNSKYRENELSVDGNYQFQPLSDREYDDLVDKFGAEKMDKIATYKICKVIFKPFQTTVSKGEVISLTRRIKIKSTVRKKRWVVGVAWATIFGPDTLANRKKKQFTIDESKIALVECGDTVKWRIGQTEDPIEMEYVAQTKNKVFCIRNESHVMLLTLDGEA